MRCSATWLTCAASRSLAQLLGVERLVLPGAEVRARRDDPRVDEAGSRRRQALDRGGCGVPELAAVAVGDCRVADVVVARGEIARGALQEERRGVEGVLQDLARRADVVGREQPVLPGQRRRMAGVVEERRQHRAVSPVTRRDEQRVVGRLVGVVAGGEALRLVVPEVTVGRQRAAAGAVRHPGRRQCLLAPRGSPPRPARSGARCTARSTRRPACRPAAS